MSGGGGSSKQKETANEKALADVSRKQIVRYQNKYTPLFRDLEKLSGEDRSGEFRGMANADMMQQLGSLPAAPTANGRSIDVTTVGTRSLADALTSGTRNSDNRQYALTRGLMDAATGSRQTSMDGLVQSASIANAEASSKLQADIARRNQNLDLAGSVVGAATSYGLDKYMNQPKTNIQKLEAAGIDPYVNHGVKPGDPGTGTGRRVLA